MIPPTEQRVWDSDFSEGGGGARDKSGPSENLITCVGPIN